MKHPDYFKRLALKRIKTEQESNKTYPITKEDLLILQTCPTCGKQKLDTIAEVRLNSGLNFLTTSICTNCLFIFRSVSPKFSWFKGCWSVIRSDKIEVFNPKAEKYKLKRYIIYKKLISPYFKRGRLLDVGASYGTGSSVFRRAGFNVNAIEAEENKITYLTKKLHIPVVATSIESSFKQIKNKYDAVIFSNCLEHLDFPISVVSKMREWLKSEGIMLLAVPHIWDAINWADALYLTHKSYFTTQNMIEVLTKNGFEIIEIIRLPFYQEMIFLIKKIPYKIKVSSFYQNQKSIVTKIKELYLKDLPIKNPSVPNKTIKYEVPHIDQFFQTVNIDKYSIKSYGDRIIFIPK